ncbi:NAD-dependent epimerase/dehydratase family protein [Bacteroidota bacterium]
MKILITGADGFVGSNLVGELLSRNHEIVAFVQYGNDPITIKDLNIDIKFGDLLDTDSINKAIEGCEALIHTAAITYVWPYRSDIQKKVNIVGTENVMKAALDNKFKKVIHVGTANSFGFGSKENPGNEERTYMADRYKTDYMDTKYEAHKLVLEMVKNENLPAVIVTPTFMFGPFATISGSVKMIESIYKEKAPGYSRGGRNYVAVKDVCVAIANALDLGKIGESYILGNENLSYKELFSLIAEVTKVKAPKLFLPDFIVKIYALVTTLFAKLFRFNPTVNYRMALISIDEHYYSPEKARKELKLPQTPIKDAVKEAFDWMKENNYL